MLNAAEQEYFLGIAEAAVAVHSAPDFFLWTQGQLQALLPHALLIGLLLDGSGSPLRCEAVHASVLPASTLALLCDADTGVVPRLARLVGPALAPLQWQRDGGGSAALMAFDAPLAASGFSNMLLYGSGSTGGSASVFALFDIPPDQLERTARCLVLLLPQLHLALGRLAAPAARQWTPGSAARALSGREQQILALLREGKKNAEIGASLGISALTVKNHLQRIYPVLGARNRTEAVARCQSLRLLARA